MILWNINRLKQLLSDGGLPQTACFYYLLLFSLVAIGGTEFLTYLPYDTPNVWRYTITVAYIASAVVGTMLFYRANGGSSGKHILERYISIGVVVAVRLVPLMLITPIGLWIYLWLTYGDREVYPVTPPEAFLTIAWVALGWARMIKHVRDVANVPRLSG